MAHGIRCRLPEAVCLSNSMANRVVRIRLVRKACTGPQLGSKRLRKSCIQTERIWRLRINSYTTSTDRICREPTAWYIG